MALWTQSIGLFLDIKLTMLHCTQREPTTTTGGRAGRQAGSNNIINNQRLMVMSCRLFTVRLRPCSGCRPFGCPRHIYGLASIYCCRCCCCCVLISIEILDARGAVISGGRNPQKEPLNGLQRPSTVHLTIERVCNYIYLLIIGATRLLLLLLLLLALQLTFFALAK